MSLKQHILDAAEAAYPKTVSLRRHLHRHPELSFAEYDTQAFVASRLKELGIDFREIAGTGLLANIAGSQGGGPSIALRGDMDALPIQEANDVVYASRNPGVMHACGHDVHTASLLGVAEILQGNRQAFGGNVRLLFQPGEEKLPGAQA